MATVYATPENPIWVKQGGRWQKYEESITVCDVDEFHLSDPSLQIGVGQVRTGSRQNVYTVLYGPMDSTYENGEKHRVWCVKVVREDGSISHYTESEKCLLSDTRLRAL